MTADYRYVIVITCSAERSSMSDLLHLVVSTTFIYSLHSLLRVFSTL